MNETNFDRDLLNAIAEIMPFNVIEVSEIDVSHPTVYIELKDGTVYYLTINKCEE